ELRRRSETVLEEVQAQLHDTLNRQREHDLQQALDRIHRATEELVQRSGKELQKLANDTLWSTTDKLNDFASRLVEQSAEERFAKELPKAANDAPWTKRDIHSTFTAGTLEPRGANPKLPTKVGDTPWTSKPQKAHPTTPLTERVAESTPAS